MKRYTAKHAEKLAAILEDHGWNIFNDGEYYCPHCGEPIDRYNAFRFCPYCGKSFAKKGPQIDQDMRAATVRFLADCVNQAAE